MGFNIFYKIEGKIIEFLLRKQKNPLVDRDLFLRVNSLAMRPMGEPKLPLYRTRHDKKNAFKVINGGLSEKRKD
ncbi:hypothetical protein A8F94_14500 [Bacillus sp. FJAT-27225]|uniref:hypothetical protein n=1 Tax=Bacillus sp. FJAT-27225 TaxID=1743144 RepID=UPI00080C2573|nr:hypothetical protein [Bacillus sp. FJAT-27225]OCA86048.1 hypothetical protein A8F94_14500 [Bacillus sp. FJAT-27225]